MLLFKIVDQYKKNDSEKEYYLKNKFLSIEWPNYSSDFNKIDIL